MEETFKVIWAPRALIQLNQEIEFIALEYPKASITILDKIIARVSQLEAHPKIGYPLPTEVDSTMGLRQLLLKPYRIIYRLDEAKKQATVLTILRQKRLLDLSQIEE